MPPILCLKRKREENKEEEGERERERVRGTRKRGIYRTILHPCTIRWPFIVDPAPFFIHKMGAPRIPAPLNGWTLVTPLGSVVIKMI